MSISIYPTDHMHVQLCYAAYCCFSFGTFPTSREACSVVRVSSMSTATLEALVSTSPTSIPPSWWNITKLPVRVARILYM